MAGSDDQDDIVDFRQSLLKKLQSDLNDALETQGEITRGSRIYWQRVHAVHQAVVVLLEAVTLPELITCLQEDACALLGLDTIALFISRDNTGGKPSMLMKPVPLQRLARDKEACVIDAPGQIVQLFPDEAATIAVALALPLGGNGFQGLLALGSRDAARFDAGLAFEPYVFLARVVERLVMRWQN